MPKVAMVTNLYHPYEIGGAEMIARNLVLGLHKSGRDVQVVTTTSSDIGEIRELIDGVGVYRFFPDNPYWVYEKSKNLLSKALWHLQDMYNYRAGQKIQKILNEIRPDIVHTHNIDSFSPIVWQVASRMGCRVIHTAHDAQPICPKANMVHNNPANKYCGSIFCWGYRQWKMSFTKYIDVFCSPSQFLLDEYRTKNLLSKQSLVVPNGLDGDKFFKLVGEVREKNSMLFLGYLSPVKGLADLMEAVRKIESTEWTLHIAGKGPMQPEIEALAKQDSRFVYHGHLDMAEKLALLKRCSILTMPSRHFENLPTSVIEGVIAGLVIVAPAKGGNIEILDGVPTGITYDPYTSHGLTDALRKSLECPLTRSPAEQETIKSAAEKYSYAKMVENYCKLYEGAAVTQI